MFGLDWDVLAATGRRAFYCEGCRRVGRIDNVRRLPCGYTREGSPWGYGIQQWILVCGGCQQRSEPLVESSDIEHLPDLDNRRRLARNQFAGGSLKELNMSTLTMKPKQVKEPRQKKQLAPLAMAREIHDAKPEPEWRKWPLEGLRAFVVSVVSRQLPRVVTAAQKCSDATAAEAIAVLMRAPFGQGVRGLHLRSPGGACRAVPRAPPTRQS